MSFHQRRPFRRTTVTGASTVTGSVAVVAGLLGVVLLLSGCDSDGAGVADAGHRDDHVDTAASSSLQQQAPQPDQPAPQPTPGGSPDRQTSPDTQTGVGSGGTAVAVGFGSYRVPMGDATLLCDFSGDPEATGYAWACEAPVHLGWSATDGGEANAVAYRPGADPEVYALLGNSGITSTGDLAPGAGNTVGERYTVDTTDGQSVTVTDGTTGVAVRLSPGSFARL